MESSTTAYGPQLLELLGAATESEAKHADQFEQAFRAMALWLSQKPYTHPQAREAIAKLGGLCLRMLATMPAPTPAPAPASANPLHKPAKAQLTSRAQKEDLVWLIDQPGIVRKEKTTVLLNINVWTQDKAAAEIERLRGIIKAHDAGFVFPPLLPGTERQQVADQLEAYCRKYQDLLGEAAYKEVYYMVQGQTVKTAELRLKLQQAEQWVEQQVAA